MFSGNAAWGRIVMSVVENIAGLPAFLALFTLDYIKTTTDVTLESQIQIGHPREVP